MPFGHVLKNIFDGYRQKYSGDRKKISITVKNKSYTLLKGFFWIIYQPYKWFALVPLLVVSTFSIGLITAVIAVLISPHSASGFAAFWARLNSFFTPMVVKISGMDNIVENQSYVIVSNHQSLYDIYVLYGWLGIDFKWVMKKELEKVPIIGIVCKTLGHIFIDRSDTKKAIDTINSAKEKIQGGTSVVFFPEGSRSDSCAIGPFKKGAFKMAVDLGIPVLPITLNGTMKILPKGSLNLMPGTVDMVIHEPIHIEGYGYGSLKDLMKKARRKIISGQYR